jgi:phytoene synthase
MTAQVSDAEVITKASKSNLALAFIALPPERRHDMNVFYAFCRIVDDLADEQGG